MSEGARENRDQPWVGVSALRPRAHERLMVSKRLYGLSGREIWSGMENGLVSTLLGWDDASAPLRAALTENPHLDSSAVTEISVTATKSSPFQISVTSSERPSQGDFPILP